MANHLRHAEIRPGDEVLDVGCGAGIDTVLAAQRTGPGLSPRKSRVMAECARVLRPGGHFCVSDLTIDEEDLPPEVLTHPAAWAG